MTQQDRGAYTPQTDAPLAFDARVPRGGRRPLPMALIGSGVVLLALLVAVVLYYRSGVRTTPAQPATVGQPVVAVKTPPSAAEKEKSDDPFSNLDVYAAQNVPATPAAAKAPTFAPPPEQPQARDGLKVQTVETSTVHAPPAAKPRPAALAAVATAAPADDAAPAPVKTAAAAPKPLEDPAKSVAVAAAKPAAPAASDPTTAGPAAVQIGAFSSTALADKGFSEVLAAFPGPMAGKAKRVEPLQRDGKTLYRGLITGFSSHGAALAFCESLKASGRSCLVRG